MEDGKGMKIIGALTLVIALLAAAVIYPIFKARFQDSEQPGPPSGVSSQEARNLYAHVDQLAARIGPRSFRDHEALARARDYIATSVRAWGYEPELQPFSYEGREYFNVECSLPGSGAPQEMIVIGAHYDTVEDTPGADDNASAVAVLLEMCRLMKDHAPQRTLKFVFFCLEERPAFATRSMGSEVYARKLREAGADVRGMISLEMLGYFSIRKGGQSLPVPLLGKGFSTTPDFIAVVGNVESGELVMKIRKSLEAGCRVPVESLAASRLIPGVDFSDHRSFWNTGYQAVMITDTAFYRNPNYHTSRDTIESLNFETMAELLKGLIKTAEDLSNPQ